MKSLFYVSLGLLCLVAVSAGCNDQAAEETAALNEVGLQGEAECCASCTGEATASCCSTTAVSTDAPAKACCGQCTSEVAAKGEAKECCGKCATTTVSTSAEPCQKCDACAKGDSENCKCDTETVTTETPAEDTSAEAPAEESAQ